MTKLGLANTAGIYALSYVWTFAAAKYLFGELPNTQAILGAVLITFGVIILATS